MDGPNQNEATAPNNDEDGLHEVLHDESLVDDALVDEAIQASLIPPLPPHNQAAVDDDHPTILLASSLKRLQASSTTILSLDTETLTSKLSHTSPTYDPSIDPTLLASHLFQKDELWHSKEALFTALSSFAALVGCKAVKSRDVIKLKSRNPNITDEGFYVKLRAVHTEKKPNDDSDGSGVAKARPVWEKEVQIREVSLILPSLKRGAEDEAIDCISTSFAYSLKKLDGLSNTIVGFDEKTFESKCCRFLPNELPNPEYDARLEMDLLAKELFKQNDIWINRDVLYHALSCFSSAFGFKVVKTRNMLVCKRYGSDNGNRNWSAGPWKVGCPFSISLKALHTERKMTESPKDPERSNLAKCRPVWEREVLIKEANCLHGGGCRPGEERVVVVKRPAKVRCS
jgi:hypothetical protein